MLLLDRFMSANNEVIFSNYYPDKNIIRFNHFLQTFSGIPLY